MHFLSAGRDERIQRWIAEQPPQPQWSQWRNSLEHKTHDHGALETVHRREYDALESVHRKEHDALVDMEWELEELERQIALTASAFGRDWRTSMLSVDTLRQSFELRSLKRASQLTVRPEGLQGILDQVNAQEERKAEGRAMSEEPKGQVLLDSEPRVPLDEPKAAPEQLVTPPLNRRREGRIISQPPNFPPDDVPRPNLSRSRTAPPPITTTRVSAASLVPRPPITFILQESASPLPSAMHFTPTPLDLDAFPTTPRSFTSFVPGQSEAHQSHLQEEQLVAPPQELLSPSPTTPYDSTGGSDASTPSLSAFPATPASPWHTNTQEFPFPPPVPSLPQADPEKPNLHHDEGDKGDGDGDSASEVSVDGQPSSRFSVFSSRFSVSSGSRSRAESRATSRSRAGSRATSRSRAGSSATPVPAPPPPTASMRGLMMSMSQQLTRSRSHTMLPRLTIRTGTGHAPSASLSLEQSSRSALEQGGRGWFGGGGTAAATPKTPAVPVPATTKASTTPATPKTPGTPVTPSSAVGAFFGKARTASMVRKQRLVVRGVKRDERCEENVRRWCENLSPVKHMWRAPGSEDVYIHFRDKNAYKKICGIETRQISISGVGTVAMTCVRGAPRN